ncbi:hypothetical protein ABPG75_011419 [Micractinium tetrahymenae]
MATLLSPASQDMFGAGHFGAAVYSLAAASVASVDAGSPGGSTDSTGGSVRRPSSPPQLVPRPRQQPPFGTAHGSWEDALQLGASPASSDAEQFLDASSELPSAASSFCGDADSAAAAMEELLSRGLPHLSAPDTLPHAAGSLSSAWPAVDAASAKQQLQQERQRRVAAEAAAAELRNQMDEVAAQLFSFRSGQQLQPPCHASTADGHSSNGSPSDTDVAALLRAVLGEAAAAVTAQQRRADAALAAAAAASAAAEGAAADAALVARMVAGMLGRAAAAEDQVATWQEEKALLERRLERAARMGQAVLKHRSEQSAEPEPWRQQLLNAAFCVGCSILGAATAALIIRRAQSG